jgi:enoyl-[acyl-carrier protein] reductase II
VDVPVIGAPMTFIAGAQLAAAVSNAGGLGIIETTSEQGRADLRRIRDLTDRPVGASISLFVERDPAFVDELRSSASGSSPPRPVVRGCSPDACGTPSRSSTWWAPWPPQGRRCGVDGLVVEGVEGGGFKNRFGASAWCCCRWSPSMSICR